MAFLASNDDMAQLLEDAAGLHLHLLHAGLLLLLQEAVPHTEQSRVLI